MIMRRTPALPSSWEVHTGLLKWYRLPCVQSHYLRGFHPISLRHKRHLHSFNVSKPPMNSPCDCSPAWTWDRHREGNFFCRWLLEEPLIQYRSGGYHPVHLGDTLHEGRYTIINKLGWGQDGTIWLAKDSRWVWLDRLHMYLRSAQKFDLFCFGRYSRLIAIKICRSEIRHESEKEAILLRRLATGPARHPGKKHIAQLLDRFEITGPNGRHLCLVVEAVGPTFNQHVLSPDAAWDIARQMVEGVSYAHDMGIAHGGTWMGTRSYAPVWALTNSSRTDLRLKKFLFTNTRFLHQDGDPTKPLNKGKVDDVQPVDGLGNVLPIYGSSVTAQVPQYQVGCPWSIPNEALTNSDNSNHTASDYLVKLVGLGKPRMTGEVQGLSEDYDFRYQAPEVLLDSQLGPSADIWSLACLVRIIIFCLPDSRLTVCEDFRGFEWKNALLSQPNKRWGHSQVDRNIWESARRVGESLLSKAKWSWVNLRYYSPQFQFLHLL